MRLYLICPTILRNRHVEREFHFSAGKHALFLLKVEASGACCRYLLCVQFTRSLVFSVMLGSPRRWSVVGLALFAALAGKSCFGQASYIVVDYRGYAYSAAPTVVVPSQTPQWTYSSARVVQPVSSGWRPAVSAYPASAPVTVSAYPTSYAASVPVATSYSLPTQTGCCAPRAVTTYYSAAAPACPSACSPPAVTCYRPAPCSAPVSYYAPSTGTGIIIDHREPFIVSDCIIIDH